MADNLPFLMFPASQFDVLKPESIGATSWANQFNNAANAVMSGVVFENGELVRRAGVTTLFYQQWGGYTYHTIYAVIKASDVPSGTGAVYIFGYYYSASSFVALAVSRATGKLRLYVDNSSTPYTTNIDATEYHVVCLMRNSTNIYLYVDGALALNIANTTSTRGAYLGIGSLYASKPTTGSSMSITTHIKHLSVFSGTHGYNNVKANSDWLAVRYGLSDDPILGFPPMSINAPAIAWAICKIIEQTKSQELQVEAFLDGTGGEPIIEPTLPEPIEFDPNPEPPGNPEVASPARIDMTNGLTYVLGDGQDVMYINIRLTVEANDYTASGYPPTEFSTRNRLWMDVYNADKELTSTYQIYTGMVYAPNTGSTNAFYVRKDNSDYPAYNTSTTVVRKIEPVITDGQLYVAVTVGIYEYSSAAVNYPPDGYHEQTITGAGAYFNLPSGFLIQSMTNNAVVHM